MHKCFCAFVALVAAVGMGARAADTISSLNPNLGVILNGRWADKEDDDTPKGFSIGETELNLSADVDPYLKGNATIAFTDENELEVEEAFIRSASLPWGLSLTAGRVLPTFGYLNEKHRHTDDFALRPLVMRRYFEEGAFHADGVQASCVLPTPLYSEIGGGAYGEGDFTAYARVGGGDAHAWRLGTSYYYRREADEDEYDGATPSQHFGGVDFKYAYSPNGNNKETEFALYGEYLVRRTSAFGGPGTWDDGLWGEAPEAGGSDKEDDSGFYAAATYKWAQRWRVGYLYSAFAAGDRADEHAVMLEYNTSEFGRFRVQVSSSDGEQKVMLQYTIAFGAHKAHSF